MLPYLNECEHDEARVVDLYRWNGRLAAAFWADLGHLEIPLRNALDLRLAGRHESKARDGDWLEDPSRELGKDRYGVGKHAQPYKDIAAAESRVKDNQKMRTRDQVLSETSFGLWHQMVSKAQKFMWPDLAGAFPHAPDRRQETISSPIAKLRHFRNRIAHHHRIWALDCSARHTDLLAVAGYIDPDLAAWIIDESAVPKILASRPI
jgi:hypothetical protein